MAKSTLKTPPASDGIPAQRFYGPKTPTGKPMMPLPKTTPPERKLSGTLTNSNVVMEAPELNSQLAKEMKGHFVGSMPPLGFIDKFLYKPGLQPCPEVPAAWARVYDTLYRKEEEMYDKFVKAVAAFTPRMKFFDTHKYPDLDAHGYAPDISGYDKFNLPDGDKKTDFSKMSIFLEFKLDPNDDPFEDPPSPAPKSFDKKNFHFERNTKESKLFRSQIGRYSASISGTQFRLCVFSVSICGPRARFIRWDRAGAVVSQSFDYIQSPDILASFFWCYANASRHAQGHDPSVSKPSNEDVEAAKEAFWEQRRISYNKFLKVMIPDRENPKVETPVLIPLPLKYNCRSPFSRATRPTLAYDLEKKRLIFMKDYWRPKDNPKEGDIYAHLREHGVRNIAEFGSGNDVRDHATLTAEITKQKWVCHRAPGEDKEPMLPELVQYRMTLLVIGRRLDEYNFTKEFVGAVMDAMEAHDDAYFKAKVLHRDVSAGNILITEDGGLLIDWDMSVMTDPKPQSARRPKRTGTWQFMSARLLKNPQAHQDIEDDRESAFWVILWIAMRTRNSYGATEDYEPEDVLSMFDFSYTTKKGLVKGGDGKRSFILSPMPVVFTGVPQLNTLLEELRRNFLSYYSNSPPSADDAPAPIPLRAQGWLVETMQKYLDKGPWPTNDVPVTTDVVLTTGDKRAAEEQDSTPQKRARKDT